MRTLVSAILFLAVAACGAPPEHQNAAPQTEHAGSLRVENSWATPTPGGVDVSAGYLSIVNETQAADRLVSASSPRASHVDIHEMSMDGGVMRMRPMDGLDIPAGGEVTLEPGGLHLMFVGVAQPFAEGEEIPVQLTFEHAGAIDVTLPVQRQAPPAHDMSDMH
jgi:periplasmic copper chaperone A